MSLKNFQTIIKNWSIPALFLITVVFTGYWWLSRGPAAEEKFGKLEPIQIKSALTKEIDVEGTASDVRTKGKTPEVMNVYVNASAVDLETIVEKLGFDSSEKEISGQRVWSEKTKNLRFDPVTAEFTYTNIKPIKKSTISEGDATVKAEQTLKGLNLIGDVANIKLEDRERLLVAGRLEATVVEGEEKFDTYSFSFSKAAGDYEVINEGGIQDTIQIWIAVDNSIVKIKASLQPLKFSDQSTYKIKSIEEVREELEKGSGTIVGIGGPIPILTKTIRVRYTDIKLTYLLTNKDKYLRPVYFAEGFTFGDRGERVEIKTIVQAVTK
ncbi:MAG: hypothetical protein WD187_03765 [Candidatus Woykebacteria bacterium]